MKPAGIVIILLGVLLTIFTAVTYFTKEKVVDIGALHVTREQPHYMQWSPIVGVVLIVVGVGVLWQSSRK